MDDIYDPADLIPIRDAPLYIRMTPEEAAQVKAAAKAAGQTMAAWCRARLLADVPAGESPRPAA